MNNTFAAVNNEMDPDTPAPTTTLRSGGPQSLAAWESLGHQGRIFVSGGPDRRPAHRVQRQPGDRADPRLRRTGFRRRHQGDRRAGRRELQRTGGLDRAVVAVATTTGTGWINEAEASALEYMYNGNTAIVSMQYSFLPSWLSFLVDKENARQAGQALFEAVDATGRELPEGKRPKLVVFGESLGSFGGEAPFLSPQQPRRPHRRRAVLRADIQQHHLDRPDPQPRRRLAGVAAHLRQGRERPIRRTRRQPRQAAGPVGPRRGWSICSTRPIRSPGGTPICCSAKPDWLRETRGYDVSPRMEWIPVVTFLQVSADMAVAVDVPDGHGHVYVKDVANAWAAILQPPGWTPEKTEKLRPLLSSDENA